MTSAVIKIIEDVGESAPGELGYQLSPDEAIQELRSHTQAYCKGVAESLEDFFGVQAEHDGKVDVQKGYCPSGDVHYSVPFSGLVNGEYIINVDESVAACLADCEPVASGADPEEFEQMREEVGAAMCELLNTAVGSVIGELAGRYPHLSFSSPRISYGQRIYPKIRFGNADLETEFGSVRCHFYLDHMELDLATSYAKVRASAQKAKAALVSHLEMVERILADIDVGVFWIQPDGQLSGRHSKASSSILGVDESLLTGSFMDLAVAHFRGNGNFAASELQSWLHAGFSAPDIEAWNRDVYPLCPLTKSSLDGTELHWRWLTVRRPDREEGISALLVAVQDAARMEFERENGASDLIAQLALNEWSLYDVE